MKTRPDVPAAPSNGIGNDQYSSVVLLVGLMSSPLGATTYQTSPTPWPLVWSGPVSLAK